MVSLIVLNFNGEGLTVRCLEALETQTFIDFELILVDNDSSDNSRAEIDSFIRERPLGRSCRVVRLGENLGFSGGNAEGLRHAKGKYIALLNNDTEPCGEWLAELCKAMDQDPEVGICASKLVSHQTHLIDSAGDGYTRALRGFKRGEGEAPEQFDQKGRVFGACAGAALYRREMIDSIGLFDEDFFLIHEDTDLNLRAKLAGWKAVFVPTATVIHKVTASIGYMSDIQVYYTLRNAEFVRMKNIPLSVLAVCFPAFVCGIISEFAFFVLKHGRGIIYLKAKRDALKALPHMLEKRRRIMSARKVGSRELLSEMTSLWDVRFLKAKWRKLLHG
ncbi:MAG TPA: glycosyltransferase family 2 protein [Syntrophorhabdaceae bacterium]|jgi:hypothetical protein